MFIRHRIFYGLVAICLIFGLTIVTPAAGVVAQKKDKAEKNKDDKDKKDKKEKKKKDKKDESDTVSARELHPVLWEEPTDIESRDLFYGPGGAEGAPDPSGKFTFERRSSSGTSEKIIVKDDRGRSWTVKFGAETKPETAATRILWAVGYHVDQDYFVKRAHIEGRGGFDVWDVRFERRDDGYEEEGIWSWHSNPFMGKRELQGLKVLMALLNNWDLKDINNKILRPKKSSGADRNERIYYIADLGGTLGSTGSIFRKLIPFGDLPAGSKGSPEDYANSVFIEGVRNGKVVFHYAGKDPAALQDVTVENARWMGDLLGRLSDKQLADAFRAGGFSDTEVQTYVRAMRNRINQLKNLR
ncbi:MAG TPA: hypothetical protein VNN73_14210 [Blastocatellia bacterium]|nr:hypothetical protein [Blastocatellia bacterium]